MRKELLTALLMINLFWLVGGAEGKRNKEEMK